MKIVDLKKEGDMSEIIIEGVTVERVSEYKYLSIVLHNKFTFKCNTNNIVNKYYQKMFRVFSLRSFCVSPKTASSLNLYRHLVLSAGLVLWV